MVRILTCCQLLSEVPGFLSCSSPGTGSFPANEDPTDYAKTVEEGKISPLLLLVLLAGLIIKLTQDRLTGEKQILFDTYGGPIDTGPKK